MGEQLVASGRFSKIWGPSLEVTMTSEGPALVLPKWVGSLQWRVEALKPGLG